MELQGDLGHVKSCFGLFRDSVTLTQDRYTICTERTIGFEFLLDAFDGTPR
jgi:hypothetical protein